MRRFGAIVLLCSVGCAHRSLPDEPSPSPQPGGTEPAFSLSGRVTDTAWRPLSGVRAEVVTGPRAGTAVTTDDEGMFRMPGTFTGTTTVLATKTGYRSATNTFPFGGRPPAPDVQFVEMALYLEPEAGSAEIVGMYTLTMTADTTCTDLPSEARTRTYRAIIAPVGGSRTRFLVDLGDARFLSPAHDQLVIGLAGDFAGILGEFAPYDPGIVELLRETTYVAIEGGASGTFTPSGIAVPFEGFFEYCPSEKALAADHYQCDATARVTCYSDRHQLVLARR